MPRAFGAASTETAHWEDAVYGVVPAAWRVALFPRLHRAPLSAFPGYNILREPKTLDLSLSFCSLSVH